MQSYSLRYAWQFRKLSYVLVSIVLNLSSIACVIVCVILSLTLARRSQCQRPNGRNGRVKIYIDPGHSNRLGIVTSLLILLMKMSHSSPSRDDLINSWKVI